MRRNFASALAFLFAFGSAAAEIDEQGYEVVGVEYTTASAADVAAGRAIYERSCEQCHGVNGDGRGVMADLLDPPPRDFTYGIYKLRHTFAGELPTEQDMFDSIARGLPGTSMLGWEGLLSDQEIWQLVHYLKTFCPDFEEFPAEEQIVIPEPPESSPESVARGREVYVELQCAKCHGEGGRGNGPSAPELKDDNGNRIWPTDLAHGWTYRGGDSPQDIYRTFVTGLNGTPMPSYAASVTAEDSWHLVNYMLSLKRKPVRDVVVRAARVSSIPHDPAAVEWQEAPGVDFELAGQIIQDPRLFTPTVDNVGVKALYDENDVAILLIWGDHIENLGDDGQPPDRAAVQFPAEPGSGNEKPYFLMGDELNPVDFWEWRAGAEAAESRLAHGMDDVGPPRGSIPVSGGYEDGSHRIVFRRARESPGEKEVQFEPGVFLPVAFNVWDGANGEEGKRRAVSAWYYLLLEPETPPSVFVWPIGAVFLGVGAQIVVLRRLRRRG